MLHSWRREQESGRSSPAPEREIGRYLRPWFVRSAGSIGIWIELRRQEEPMSDEPKPAKGVSAPAVMIVMGVSGSGKSTIGALLARCLHWEFEDADWLHPAANVDKMHNGIPLTDEDRRPWLEAVATWIDNTRRSGAHAVVACSALKRRYRDVLIG